MNWKKEKVFVTGADGFIGSWLTKRLLAEGAEVTVLVRDRPHDARLKLFKIRDKVSAVYGSLTDFQLISRAFNEYSITTCFHLAAQTLVGIANRSPLATFESNIKGTWNVLEAARLIDMPNVVVASSDKAYGDHEKLPYTEDFPLQGRHPYDASKSCSDIIAQTYAKTYGLNAAISRCGNIYGGGDFNWSRIVPGTILSLLKNERPTIRSDGTFVREYLYVEDAVDAYMILAETLTSKKVKGEAFNFGTEQPLTVLEIVDRILKVAGKDLKPNIMGDAPNEILKQYLDSTKAKTVLKWQPKHNLDEGLKKTFDWYKDWFNSQ